MFIFQCLLLPFEIRVTLLRDLCKNYKKKTLMTLKILTRDKDYVINISTVQYTSYIPIEQALWERKKLKKTE